MNTAVDEYFKNVKKWRDALQALRSVLLECGLTEALKWRQPCYAFEDGNVAIIGEFKDYCALSFFKGVLLKDPHGILVAPGENTRSGRLIAFTSVEQIVATEPILKAYIAEAIEIEKAGLKVDFEKDRELELPEELLNKFDEIPALKAAFEALTPGRQRAYVLHFSAAKQSTTRESRIEKSMQAILDGKGLNDCTCGLSKKLPACDGSHKQLR